MNLLVYNAYNAWCIFGLRVVDEHKTMKFGEVQLSIVENRECLTFTERGTKTSNGDGPFRAEPPRAFSFGGFFKTHNFKTSNKTILFSTNFESC